MANKEQHNGRMLFTDFDASDKGRPVAVLPEEPPVPAPAPLPAALPALTLDDIAARLELDFEDDGDGVPEPARAHAPQAAEPPKTVSAPPPKPAPVPAPQEAADDLLLTDAEDVIRLPDFHPAPQSQNAPTWDSLASAYERARPVESLPLERMAGAFEAQTHTPPANEDESVDILSMLDEWMERQTRVIRKKEDGSGSGSTKSAGENTGESTGETDGENTPPFPEARHIPYGGIERVDDWFAPPEKQKDPFERIENWFAPPETPPETGEVQRIENWFEPPEGQPETQPQPEPGVDIRWLSDFRNELPSGDYWRKQTTRIFKKDAPAAAASVPAAHSPASAETSELFAGVDIDGIWEQKVEEKQQQRSANPAETGSIDLFDNLDIESLWEEKQNRRQKESPKTNAAGADQTMILKPGDLDDAAGTVVVRKSLISQRLKPRPAPAAAAATSAAPAAAPVPPAPTPDEADDVFAAFADLDKKAAEPKTAQAAAAAPAQPRSPSPAAAENPAAPPPAAERPAAKSSVVEHSAPEAAPADPASDPEADPFAVPMHSGSDGDADVFDLDALVEEAADMNFSGSVFGDGSPSAAGGDGEEREYVARTPPAGGAKKKGLTTDDLLDDIDMESFEGEAGDVSAPVIDDSAIDRIPRPAPPQAEGEAAAPEEAPPAEAVAVNPMDVFADMDNMDFSDDVDDDMRSMLDDEEGELEEEEGGATEDAQTAAGHIAEKIEIIPTTRLGLLRYNAVKFLKRVLPMTAIDKVSAMVAWRENWWFYCDLAAAVLASASLAVIISYFFWYR